MDIDKIKLNSKMNQTVIDLLKVRGDNISLYAVKLITELQKEVIGITVCEECQEIICECDKIKDKIKWLNDNSVKIKSLNYTFPAWIDGQVKYIELTKVNGIWKRK